MNFSQTPLYFQYVSKWAKKFQLVTSAMRAKPCVFFALTESRQGCILQSVVAFSFHWISRDDNVESWVGTTFYQHSPASTEPVCKQEAEGRRKPRSSFQYSFVPLRLPFCRLLGCHCTFPIFWFTPNLTFFQLFYGPASLLLLLVRRLS